MGFLVAPLFSGGNRMLLTSTLINIQFSVTVGLCLPSEEIYIYHYIPLHLYSYTYWTYV